LPFHAAREADPKALLTLNDNNVEYATAFQLVRRRALLAVIDGLLRRGAPIDAIGIQSHLSTAIADKLDQNSLASFLKEISDRNLKIMVTEMDAIDVGSPSDIAARDMQVASLFKRYLDVVVDNRATTAVATWGLSDKESWITRGDLKDFRRSDGLPPRPLPFDDLYRPKKAYYAIAGALHAAPNR
jgi:endo-1,4-beta-xylanase